VLKNSRDKGMAQEVQHLPSSCEVLGSIPRTPGVPSTPGWAWWLTSVTPPTSKPTWEAEIGGLQYETSLSKNLAKLSRKAS
jgi:hypothetical protein